VADILDFSKIESGRVELEHQPFSLSHCVEEVCAFFAPQARVNRLTLEHRVDPDVPTFVIGDPARIRQILTNLVGNAVKFTPRGSVTIAVACTRIPAETGTRSSVRLFFTITDTGIGIPADTIKRLFLPFSQVDVSPQRRREGTGLGLAISKRLCELMGGSISAESRAGEGSTFRFTLQCEIPADSPGGIAPSA